MPYWGIGRGAVTSDIEMPAGKDESTETTPQNERIKVGPYFYTVEFGEVMEGKDWGRADTNKQVIRVDPSGSDTQTSVYLLHEMFHVVAKEFTTALDEEDKLEESLVSALAFGIATIWKDNPGIFEFIRKGIEDG
jgi:hypothetical protein